jgi:dTMP kinase
MTDLAPTLAGKFLVVDGPDGAGKSTQMRMLAEYLTARHVPLTVTRDPGGTAVGDKIRAILLDNANGDIAPACELMLYMASRAQLVAEVIQPALTAGRCVLCDRYVSSTIAYQGAAGVDAATIRQVAQPAVGSVWPDLTIIVDVPAEFGLGRAGRAGGHDRMESKSLEFHRRVRESFLAQARENPARFVVIDGRATPQEVHQKVVDSLARLQVAG